MKLQTKFTLYSTLPKLVIIGVIIMVLPRLIEFFVYRHTDTQLNTTRDQVINYIKKNGVGNRIGPEGISQQMYDDDFTNFLSVVPMDQGLSNYPENIPPGNAQRKSNTDIKDYRVLSQQVNIDGRNYQIDIGQSLDAIQKLEQTINRFAIYLMLALSMVVLAIDIGFTRMILRPLENIIAKLKSVKKPENFDFSVVKTSTGEFRYLDETVNQMMRQINEAFLKEKEFVGTASHEMLTPIAVLNSRFENMITDQETPVDISEKLVDSQGVLLRLNKIIKSLLLISKVEYNYYVKEDTVNIHELLEEVIEYSDDRMETKNISVNMDVDSNYAMKQCNRSLLFTMFANLVSNAIKYNKEGGEISIKSKYVDKHFAVVIADTGVGIAPQEIDYIFEGFRKLKTDNNESNRLGLHIVKSIANMHQIEIKVESELHKGSTFTLIFKS